MSEALPLVRRILMWAGIAVVVLAALWFASRIPRTLTVFVVAGLIAFGVHPVTRLLERRMRPALAIALVYVSLLALLIVIAFLVIPATIAQMQRLIVNAPAYVTLVQGWIGDVQAYWLKHFHSQLVPAGFDVKTVVGDKMGQYVGLAFNSIGTIVVGTMSVLFIGISSLILSFYFLLNAELVGSSFSNLFPPDRRDSAHALANEITRIFGGFIAGQFILCAIVGVSIWAILALVGFHYALLIGVLSGFGYAIPFVGMLIAQIVGAVLAATQSAAMVVWVSTVLFLIARVADNVLVPKIMSESVGVSPIGVMFAVFAGGELFGLPGLVLGIPAAALIKVLWKFFMMPFFMRIEAQPPDFAEPELEPIDITIEVTSTQAR